MSETKSEIKSDDPVEQEALAKRSFPPNLPLLTSSEVVIYPYMAAPLMIEDEEAIQTIEAALKTGHKVVALFGRIPTEGEDTSPPPTSSLKVDDLNPVGSAIQLVRSQRTPDGRLQLLVQ